MENNQVAGDDGHVALIRPRAPLASQMVGLQNGGVADLLVRGVRSRDRGPIAHHVNPCTCHTHVVSLCLLLCKFQCTAVPPIMGYSGCRIHTAPTWLLLQRACTGSRQWGRHQECARQ